MEVEKNMMKWKVQEREEKEHLAALS